MLCCMNRCHLSEDNQCHTIIRIITLYLLILSDLNILLLLCVMPDFPNLKLPNFLPAINLFATLLCITPHPPPLFMLIFRYLLSPLYYYSVHWTVNHFIEGRGFLWTVSECTAVPHTVFCATNTE